MFIVAGEIPGPRLLMTALNGTKRRVYNFVFFELGFSFSILF